MRLQRADQRASQSALAIVSPDGTAPLVSFLKSSLTGRERLKTSLRIGAACCPFLLPSEVFASTPQEAFLVSIGKSLVNQPSTGRVLVLISRRRGEEPRLTDQSVWYNNLPSPRAATVLLASDVSEALPGQSLAIDERSSSYPLGSIRDIPAGDYNIQAVFNLYTRFVRSNGRAIWAHKDNGEGQDFFLAPGNLLSTPIWVHLDPLAGYSVRLTLDHKVPPIPAQTDSKFVKHLRFTSRLASAFWGQDMNVNLTIALPAGYDEHPDRRYPVLFQQAHFGDGAVFSMLEPPLGARDGKELSAWGASTKDFVEAWRAGRVPQMIVVSMQHPTPFYDDSYFINSPNTGPWSDVFIREVIPYVDSHFRTVAKPFARVMAGMSAGGFTSAYLQIHYPRLFGGAWIFAPDPLDFRDFYTINLYTDKNAYFEPGHPGNLAVPRYEYRSTNGQPLQTMQGLVRYFDVLGTHGRSGQWIDNYDAMWGNIGPDGYPVPVWNHQTGDIDPKVVASWRAHGADLREYLEANWSSLAPHLIGKLHFAAGTADNFFLNNGEIVMQEFLAKQKPPLNATFRNGTPAGGHSFFEMGYDPFPEALLEEMVRDIASHAPSGFDTSSWEAR